MFKLANRCSGIRQIKFSALESNWQEKIGKVRAKELNEQWNVYMSVLIAVLSSLNIG